jgi:hypothetical protein
LQHFTLSREDFRWNDFKSFEILTEVNHAWLLESYFYVSYPIQMNPYPAPMKASNPNL